MIQAMNEQQASFNSTLPLQVQKSPDEESCIVPEYGSRGKKRGLKQHYFSLIFRIYNFVYKHREAWMSFARENKLNVQLERNIYIRKDNAGVLITCFMLNLMATDNL